MGALSVLDILLPVTSPSIARLTEPAAEQHGDAVEEAAGVAVGVSGGELEAGGDGDPGPVLGGAVS